MSKTRQLNINDIEECLRCVWSEELDRSGSTYRAIIDLVELSDESEAYRARIELMGLDADGGVTGEYEVIEEALYRKTVDAQKALKEFKKSLK